MLRREAVPRRSVGGVRAGWRQRAAGGGAQIGRSKARGCRRQSVSCCAARSGQSDTTARHPQSARRGASPAAKADGERGRGRGVPSPQKCGGRGALPRDPGRGGEVQGALGGGPATASCGRREGCGAGAGVCGVGGVGLRWAQQKGRTCGPPPRPTPPPPPPRQAAPSVPLRPSPLRTPL